MHKCAMWLAKFANSFKTVKSVGLRVLAALLLASVFITAQSTAQTPVAAAPAAVCHSTWKGNHGHRGLVFPTGWTEVKWTSNPCRNLLRGRTQCVRGFDSGTYYVTKPGGVVVAAGRHAPTSRTYCHNKSDYLCRGELQWRRPGPGRHWSAWQNWWRNGEC